MKVPSLEADLATVQQHLREEREEHSRIKQEYENHFKNLETEARESVTKQNDELEELQNLLSAAMAMRDTLKEELDCAEILLFFHVN